LNCFVVSAQKDELKTGFGCMFYNCENLFDCFDDSLSTGDDEYLPESSKHWTFKRYQTKLNNIARVILAAGKWSPPVFVGLCEIENVGVMKNLVWWTGLSNLNYRFVHFESPDSRGIDVALLYRSNVFKVDTAFAIPVTLPGNVTTRDILYVKGYLAGFDTLHLFVNHWPSRYGGAEASGIKREVVAAILRNHCDSLLNQDVHASVLIMGDFNDGPEDMSITTLVKSDENGGLVNMVDYRRGAQKGSHKFKQQWDLIDQIIVSKSLLSKVEALAGEYEFRVVDLPFLFRNDESFLGEKPFRTYDGPVYKGGFSDHLPVYASFFWDIVPELGANLKF
jgi:exonuclease III